MCADKKAYTWNHFLVYNGVKVLLFSRTLKHKLGITSEEFLDESQQRRRLFDGCCNIPGRTHLRAHSPLTM